MSPHYQGGPYLPRVGDITSDLCPGVRSFLSREVPHKLNALTRFGGRRGYILLGSGMDDFLGELVADYFIIRYFGSTSVEM